jgi:hypothetical protein
VDRSILVRPPRRFTHKRNKLVFQWSWILQCLLSFAWQALLIFRIKTDNYRILVNTEVKLCPFSQEFKPRSAPIWLHNSSSVKLLPEGVECMQRRSSVDELYKQQVTWFIAVVKLFNFYLSNDWLVIRVMIYSRKWKVIIFLPQSVSNYFEIHLFPCNIGGGPTTIRPFYDHLGQMSSENDHPDGRKWSFLSESVAKFFVRSKLKIGLHL